uniref:Uncharacterized protein n=1 Tax=Nelumbo nucifera TaxID=4432 RepID=A0A822YWX4_NELNU|nr:TPA_asm: hypothetical protein HUJ06_007833 [Nelumbo nucifera]
MLIYVAGKSPLHHLTLVKPKSHNFCERRRNIKTLEASFSLPSSLVSLVEMTLKSC